MHRACRAAIAADVAREICRIVRFGTVMHRRSCSPARLETPDSDGQSWAPLLTSTCVLRTRHLVGAVSLGTSVTHYYAPRLTQNVRPAQSLRAGRAQSSE